MYKIVDQKIAYEELQIKFSQFCVKTFDYQGLEEERCGSTLVTNVILKNGMLKYYPLKEHCYKSMIDVLKTLLKRQILKKLVNIGTILKLMTNYMATFMMEKYGNHFIAGMTETFSRYQEVIINAKCGLVITDISVGVLYKII